MRNIKLIIEYNGINYQGWQRQKNTQKTLQEVIEKTLAKILKEDVRLIASGRTDAGVHAAGQVANFKTRTKMSTDKIKQALNGLLADDIVIKKCQDVVLKFHARFDAKAKIYRYMILNQKYPTALWRDYVYFVPYKLDVRLMQKAARVLAGRHDFAGFQARPVRNSYRYGRDRISNGTSDNIVRDSIRTIKRIKVYRVKDFTPDLAAFPKSSTRNRNKAFIFIDIEANSFLYKMVRNIVGTLIEIGEKRLSAESIQEILRLKDRQFAGPTAPGHGLCLLRVKY